MKLAIVEFSSVNHSVMIENWVRVCECNGWSYFVATRADIYNEISRDINLDIDNVSISPKVTALNFMKIIGFLKSCDVIVITSLQGNFLHYLILLMVARKVILTIHNVNAWFLPGSDVTAKGRLKGIFRSIWRKKASGFVVNSTNMRNALDALGLCDREVSVVPFSMRFKKLPQLTRDDLTNRFTVVAPGMVSEKRKSYNVFLNLAKNNPHIEFVMLGKAILEEGAKEIVSYIKAEKLMNVKYFTAHVPQEVFESVMQSANLIFSDINVNYENDGVVERYGVTKDSGVSYLMLEYGLPLLVNSEFNNLDGLNLGTIKFESESDAERALLSVVNNKDYYLELRRKIVSARPEFEVEAVSQRVKSHFSKIIE